MISVSLNDCWKMEREQVEPPCSPRGVQLPIRSPVFSLCTDMSHDCPPRFEHEIHSTEIIPSLIAGFLMSFC